MLRSFCDDARARRQRAGDRYPEPNTARANYARTVRMTSPEPSYVMGYNQVPVVVVVPGTHYVATRPVYMIAPSAKIISIEAD